MNLLIFVTSTLTKPFYDWLLVLAFEPKKKIIWKKLFLVCFFIFKKNMLSQFSCVKWKYCLLFLPGISCFQLLYTYFHIFHIIKNTTTKRKPQFCIHYLVAMHKLCNESHFWNLLVSITNQNHCCCCLVARCLLFYFCFIHLMDWF